MNVASLFEKCARHFGAAPALRDLETGEALDFAALHLALGRIALQLDALGIGAGERVALLGSTEAAHLVCDYGVMAAGRVRVPLDPSLSVAEQVAQIRDAEARTLVFTPAFAQRAEELAQQVEGLRMVAAAQLRKAEGEPSIGREYPGGESLASLSYTGGTTGGPKAVMVTHGSLTAAVQNIVGARGMGPGDVMLNMRPAWPIAAIVLLAHLAAGGTVLMAGRFEPASFLTLLHEHRVAATSLVPTHLARLMSEAEPRAFDLSSLRAMDIGAAAVPPELFARVLDAFGARVGILYGLTEAPWTCYQPPSAFGGSSEERRQRMRSVGRPLFGAEVVIRSPEGTALAMGEEGEVTIRGAHVTPGYWRRPQADAAAFRDGWFRTGDLGAMDAEGCLSITGRIKELIRSGGKSIVPAEVEAVLREHPAVADAAVLGLPDAEWGESVAAAVVLRAGEEFAGAMPDEPQLIEWCRLRLSSFKKPRRVFFLAEIPRSHYGKVQRAPLLKLIEPNM
jgi:acyl-CoA synthetase (AMP-forming)/AMP-acid ligase II